MSRNGDFLDKMGDLWQCSVSGHWRVDEEEYQGYYGILTDNGSLTWDDHGGAVFSHENAVAIVNAQNHLEAMIATLEKVHGFCMASSSAECEEILGILESTFDDH